MKSRRCPGSVHRRPRHRRARPAGVDGRHRSGGRQETAAMQGAMSSASPVARARRCWRSSRSATSGSRSTTPRARSCSRRSRPARPATRPRPASTASCRRRRCTSPTSMKTATCPSCSASPGPASPCTPACCRASPPRTAACACRIAFAQRLFDLTDIGLRVIVVRDDIAPSRHRASGPLQAESGPQEAGAGHAAARPFVRQRPSAGEPASAPPLRDATRRRQARPGTCKS